jgi:hypothetical protein
MANQANFYKTEAQRPTFIKTKSASAGPTLLTNAQARPVLQTRTLTAAVGAVGTGYSIQADGIIPVVASSGTSRGYLTVAGADANGAITYTLVNMGMDDVTISVVVAVANPTRTIVVTPSTHNIVVNVVTSGSVIQASETAISIVASINASASANALVSATLPGTTTGASLVAVAAAAPIPQGLVDNAVAISGYTQIYTGIGTAGSLPTGTQFSVNYVTGKVTFAAAATTNSVTLVYKSGILVAPATITTIKGSHQKVFGRLIRPQGHSNGASSTYRTDFFDLSSSL